MQPSLDKHLTPVPFVASPEIQKAIRALGRTEDISFSADGRHLALVSYYRHRVAVLKAHVHRNEHDVLIELTQLLEIESDVLNRPHGVDFINEHQIAVTSRSGGLDVFAVPERNEAVCTVQQEPLLSVAAEPDGLLNIPGSVCVVRSDEGRAEIVVCNNAGNTLSRHEFESDGKLRWGKQSLLLTKWLNLPDGLAVSRDGRWLAVSSHESRVVLIFDRSQALSATSDPVGILRQVFAPHGLQFSPDGKQLIVADADTPYLQVYEANAFGWYGVRHPVATLRVMDDATYQRGHYAPGEGGVKGVSLCRDTGVLATTCHHQPMAFFDLPALKKNQGREADLAESAENRDAYLARCADEVRYELLLMSQVVEAHMLNEDVISSASWRLTKPLRAMKRWVKSVL